MSAGLGLTLASGLAAGALHVVGGIDHLAALLPLSVGQRRRAFGLGVRWGLGHSAGVLVIGALGVALRERLDLAAVGGWGERLVGVMLIGIGLLGIRRAARLEAHVHRHQHDGEAHSHLHVHGPRDAHVGESPAPLHRHRHTAFFAGTVHGVAGTAHVLGVLPALALPTLAASGGYLAAFAVGTILAMGAFASLVGMGSERAAGRAPSRLRGLLGAAGAAAVLVGLVWLLFPALGWELPELG